MCWDRVMLGKYVKKGYSNLCRVYMGKVGKGERGGMVIWVGWWVGRELRELVNWGKFGNWMGVGILWVMRVGWGWVEAKYGDVLSEIGSRKTLLLLEI